MHNRFFLVSAKQSTTLFKLFSTASQFLSRSGFIFPSKNYSYAEHQSIEKAQEILDLVAPGKSRVQDVECHHRLIQSCMQDLLKNDEVGNNSTFIQRKGAGPAELFSHKDLYFNDLFLWMSNKSKLEDPTQLFLSLQNGGINADESTFSCLLSVCVARGDLSLGLQFHALAVKFGFDKFSRVGNSLISLYFKCGMLENMHQVFWNMTARNTISWTSIITSYAQHSQYEASLNLFNLMRATSSKPNDFTFASILSICRSGGTLGLGRSLHCLELKMGFDSQTHVLNALISMYSKCGNIEEARCVFEEMQNKDLISWNSMIFGYSHYGFAEDAICLLREMNKHNTKPDSISFLGVLSTCRHAGLVEQGLDCFNYMLELGIEPGFDHYSCVVDLLGRAGLLERALSFIEKLPVRPCAVIWGSLLSSSRVHGRVWIGIHAAENRLLLEPGCAATHLQLANLYASVECWDQVARVRKQLKDKGIKPHPGSSWIEVGEKIYIFKAEDRSNSQVNEILDILDSLADHMKFPD
ncbi:Pentatricopeptide repeat-containing protein [Apostasia shenzhenica]|uniref:Pentatricopeptide repeat-containing protein n=1 Tax=Apostasia shenzhenica TaxID=1088818 RepID=A0A2I0B670_9ASPA|nr:Pentatricopeptide repeat-containing protein [Apostasia shenzhenica]